MDSFTLKLDIDWANAHSGPCKLGYTSGHNSMHAKTTCCEKNDQLK